MITVEQKVPTYTRNESGFLVTDAVSLIVRSISVEGAIVLSFGVEEILVDADDLRAAITNALNTGVTKWSP